MILLSDQKGKASLIQGRLSNLYVAIIHPNRIIIKGCGK